MNFYVADVGFTAFYAIPVFSNPAVMFLDDLLDTYQRQVRLQLGNGILRHQQLQGRDIALWCRLVLRA